MTTFTCTAAQSTYQPREVADGVAVVVGQFSWSAVPSAGEIIQLFKVPANNTLLQIVIQGTDPNAAIGQALKIGTAGLSGTTSPSYIDPAVTMSALMTPVLAGKNGVLPLFCGVSDKAAQQYVIITAKTAGANSGTSNSVLRFFAMYGRRGTTDP